MPDSKSTPPCRLSSAASLIYFASWYQITCSNGGALTAFIPAGQTGGTSTTVYFAPYDGSNYFKWQLFPSTNISDGPVLSYAMRPWSVPGGYFNAVVDGGSAALRPMIGLGALWNFTDTNDGDGSFYLSNAANGSDWRLDLK